MNKYINCTWRHEFKCWFKCLLCAHSTRKPAALFLKWQHRWACFAILQEIKTFKSVFVSSLFSPIGSDGPPQIPQSRPQLPKTPVSVQKREKWQWKKSQGVSKRQIKPPPPPPIPVSVWANSWEKPTQLSGLEHQKGELWKRLSCVQTTCRSRMFFPRLWASILQRQQANEILFRTWRESSFWPEGWIQGPLYKERRKCEGEAGPHPTLDLSQQIKAQLKGGDHSLTMVSVIIIYSL